MGHCNCIYRGIGKGRVWNMRVSEDEKDEGSIALLLYTCAPNAHIRDSRLPTLLGPRHISQVKLSASFPPAPSAHMCFKNTSFSSNIAKRVARRAQKFQEDSGIALDPPMHHLGQGSIKTWDQNEAFVLHNLFQWNLKFDPLSWVHTEREIGQTMISYILMLFPSSATRRLSLPSQIMFQDQAASSHM